MLSGICNGIDVDVWNPETDNRIASRFSRSSLPARSLNKAELQRRFALGQDPERLLFGVVSRLAWHKGIDILADAIPALIGRGGQLPWRLPDDLKRFVQAAHARGLMVFLDVVYNHFGPEGNYLHAYAEPFFNPRHQTPWGAAINFDGPLSRTVRDFFIHNALYWLDEYHFDGLRLDAVHAIADDTQPHILHELAEAIRAGPGCGRVEGAAIARRGRASQALRRAFEPVK